jgi:hypothetical protein
MNKILQIELMVSGIRIKNPYDDSHGFQVSKIEFMFGEKAIPNSLSISYKVNVPVDIANNQTAIDSLLQNEIDPALKILSLLLNRPYRFLSYRAWINAKEVRFEGSPKPAPFHLYNFESPIKRYFENSSYSVLIRKEMWPDFQLAVDTFRLPSSNALHQFELPLHWFGMASQESYSPDRFISFWIAFNGLYANPKQPSEKKAIEYYLEKNIDEIFATGFIQSNKDLLITLCRNRIELRPNRIISEELERCLQTQNIPNIEKMKLSFLALYGIRNHLFHGSYSLSSNDVFYLTEISETILSDFLRRQLLKFLKVIPKQIVIEESTGI